MAAFYNEIDPYAAQWLRNLIAAGHIAPGVVDERSIEDIHPYELERYTQCHFFAGIGVWSHALRMAGVPDDQPLWTGSCPCQPFSAAGKGAGFADERHLWPAFHHLIRECRPAVVLGEQVASRDVDPWIDLVHADVEAMGYAFGCVPFPAAGVGAPQPRDRAFWVARSDGDGRRKSGLPTAGRLATYGRAQADQPGDAGSVGRLADMSSVGRREECSHFGGIAQGDCAQGQPTRPGPGGGPVNGFWQEADWIECCDPGGARWRPVEPGTFPLAHGAPSRVGRLRAYGNAINGEAAAAFIRAALS